MLWYSEILFFALNEKSMNNELGWEKDSHFMLDITLNKPKVEGSSSSLKDCWLFEDGTEPNLNSQRKAFLVVLYNNSNVFYNFWPSGWSMMGSKNMLSLWSSLQVFYFFLFGQVSSAESKRRSNRSLEHFGTGSYNPHMTESAGISPRIRMGFPAGRKYLVEKKTS